MRLQLVCLVMLTLLGLAVLLWKDISGILEERGNSEQRRNVATQLRNLDCKVRSLLLAVHKATETGVIFDKKTFEVSVGNTILPPSADVVNSLTYFRDHQDKFAFSLSLQEFSICWGYQINIGASGRYGGQGQDSLEKILRVLNSLSQSAVSSDRLQGVLICFDSSSDEEALERLYIELLRIPRLFIRLTSPSLIMGTTGGSQFQEYYKIGLVKISPNMDKK